VVFVLVSNTGSGPTILARGLARRASGLKKLGCFGLVDWISCHAFSVRFVRSGSFCHPSFRGGWVL